MLKGETGRNSLLAVVAGFGILLALSNWWLLYKNARLQRSVEHYDAMGHTPVGVALPALHGKDLDGRPASVEYQQHGPETLIFVFSPMCDFSRTIWPTWSEVSQRCSTTRAVFANIKGDLTKEFLNRYPTGTATVLGSVDPASILAYEFRETPSTVLLAPDGTSKAVWRGVMDPSAIHQLKTAIGCQSR